ncbi:hypothetical protein [Mammaliicoccus fleurettii]|uniref:hypothetical protein n=1 Tax=Mammaliicoccus fleurettii TaxID=150056 RepID=UPI002DBD526E|nr:hypothetical protein [Mammaliicoccus fleurettii]MEB8068775.1 hypothetical protein [Mammaliicoccus fleurettii]
MKLRIMRLQLYIVFTILIIIAVLHLFDAYQTYGINKLLENTPYTQSLLFDGYSGFQTVFLLMMPLAVSIGVSDIFIQDRKQHLLHHAYMYHENKSVDIQVILYSSIVALLLVIIPLLINFVGEFLILPDILPERMTINPIGIFSWNTLSVHLYYKMPLLYILLYISLTGIWGAIMNVFAITLSLYTNKRILAMIGPFIFQILLIILSNLTYEPFIVPPIYFLMGRTEFMYFEVLPILLTLGLFIGLSIYFYVRGMYKNELN